jgi:hypothetical protein
VTAIAAPIVVAMDPRTWPGSVVRADQPDVCVFYRSLAGARAGSSVESLVFDASGHRLVNRDGELHISPTDPDAQAELAALLVDWLGYMDAIRGSLAGTPLADLIEMCVDHAVDCGLYR